MRQILIEKAKVSETIPYSGLTKQITTINIDPESYALAAMLGEISGAEDDVGRGMLSVIVVHKSGDMKPGRGFFEFAEELGRDTSDEEKCWVDELKKVYAHWQQKNT